MANVIRSLKDWLLGTNETMYFIAATSLMNAQARIVNSLPTLEGIQRIGDQKHRSAAGRQRPADESHVGVAVIRWHKRPDTPSFGLQLYVCLAVDRDDGGVQHQCGNQRRRDRRTRESRLLRCPRISRSVVARRAPRPARPLVPRAAYFAQHLGVTRGGIGPQLCVCSSIQA